MNTLKELFRKKPSEVIRAMVDGLREHAEREDFEIDMATFGMVGYSFEKKKTDLCFGCAATCALQRITGVHFNVDNIDDSVGRAEAVNLPASDVKYFESMVDAFRAGSFTSLLYYCDLPVNDANLHPEFPLPLLTTKDWPAMLPPYEAYAKKLEKLGY